MEARPGLRAALVFLVAVAAALHARQLFAGETWVLRDHLVYTWTERKILADALRAGRLPEWNALVGLGTPFAASSANGVTYPPLWLVALLPLPLGMDALVAVHVLAAGVGTALLSRRLGAGRLGVALAGAALMACGYVASIAPNKIFPGTALLPWVLWAVDRVATAAPDRRALVRDGAILAAVVGAQLLAGDPAAVITSAVAAVALALARARARRPALAALAAGGAGALLLAAAGVLPGLALLPDTTRAALPGAEGTTWSLHPLRLVELVWPRALGDPVSPSAGLAAVFAARGAVEPSWSYSLFLGAPILALAALAAVRGLRGARGIAIGVTALVVLALGPATPVYSAFRAVFPPESIVRYPEKHVAGALVLLCALAGAGLAELRRRPGGAGPWALGAALAALALPLAAVAVLRDRLVAALAGGAALVDVDPAAAVAIAVRSGTAALVASAAASAGLLAWARGGRGRLAGPAAVLLLAGHAAWEASAVAPLAPAAGLRLRPALLEPVLRARAPGADAPPPRVLRSPLVDAALPPRLQAAYRQETLVLDAPGRWGVAAVPGFEGWQSRRFAALWSAAGGMPARAFLALFSIEWAAVPRALAPALGAGGRAEPLLAEVMLDVAAEGRASEGFGWTVVRTASPRPRAFVAPRWRWAEEGAATSALVDPARAADPGLVVLTGPGGTPSAAEREGIALAPCAVTAWRPERAALTCDSRAGGFAVLVEENAPGWSAAVDGAPTPIATADVVLRAVPIGPGRHEVVFSYRTPWLLEGAIVSAAAWLAWAALWVVLARRRRLGPPSPAAGPHPGAG